MTPAVNAATTAMHVDQVAPAPAGSPFADAVAAIVGAAVAVVAASRGQRLTQPEVTGTTLR